MLIAALLMLTSDPQVQVVEHPPMQCEDGPLKKHYGGSPWLVYGCADRNSLVVVSDKDNPAAPFFFLVREVEGQYRVIGEGNGSKEASSAAFKELERLTAKDIRVLLLETRK